MELPEEEKQPYIAAKQAELSELQRVSLVTWYNNSQHASACMFTCVAEGCNGLLKKQSSCQVPLTHTCSLTANVSDLGFEPNAASCAQLLFRQMY